MAATGNYFGGATRTTADERVIEAVREVVAEAFPRGLRAIVLTGSLARGEGTWTYDKGSYRLAGDAEFLLVFSHAALPSAEHIVRLKVAIAARLCTVATDAQIGLSAVRHNYLRRIRPHIFAYELITYGQVVWGDAHILNLVPSFSSSDIPLEDGFHLLVNRMIELLEALCESEAGEPLADTVRYRALKLWLDMGTSFLLFARKYEPSYRDRAARLAEMASASTPLSPVSRFAERVSAATRCKLGESQDFPVAKFADLANLIQDAHRLWRWQLAHLTGASPAASDEELLRQWIAGQETLARMRGWVAVAKRYRTTRSLASLPWWITQALKGSPRRLLYAAASVLFFALPRLLIDAEGCDSGRRWNELRLALPVAGGLQHAAQSCAWRELGRSIAWNYHHFLELTRS